jgi:hypothetical protein
MALTVHELPAVAVDGAARTRRGRWQMAFVLLICAMPVIASYFMYFVVRPEGRSNYGTLITPPLEMPSALRLTDLQGQPVAPASLRRQWLLLVVAPAACLAPCEQQLYMQRQLRETLGRESERLDKLWLVTDGQPIAPPLQQAVLAAPAAQVLRADRAQLAAWLQPEPGRALEDHLYLVDPMGMWMMRLPADADPKRVQRDLIRLLRASGFWDQPGR